MPIAHCFVSGQLTGSGDELIQNWAEASGVAADLLTVNLIHTSAQFGVPYAVMAQLLLPSAWSSEQAATIQLALANSLGQYFSVPPEQVHVVTQVVESGYAVENGEIQRW